MNLAFADRDFYYGDPYFPPEEPIEGLLSKGYAAQRASQINWDRNDPEVKPGDPYPFIGKTNPYLHLLENWPDGAATTPPPGARSSNDSAFEEIFASGTTSIQTADEAGWVVSITPSGGWIPAVIAGRTGIGMSQRAQSFVLSEAENPFNVIEPGKRPRVTLTPGLALKDGRPFLSFAVQGGDTQDQNLLQFFLNVVEFGMNVQEAADALQVSIVKHLAELTKLSQSKLLKRRYRKFRRMGEQSTYSQEAMNLEVELLMGISSGERKTARVSRAARGRRKRTSEEEPSQVQKSAAD